MNLNTLRTAEQVARRNTDDVITILRKQFANGRPPVFSRWYWQKFWPKQLAQVEGEIK